jgi:[NiFe] hydrogenase large subunit
VIDPIPRIEGHLRIEVEVENGKVKDAWSSGTLFRGFEIILQGRDPRDAWFITQRICGVCPVSHGHTSTLGLEQAFRVTPPDNARIVRNLIEGGQFVHSHILWFYQLNALDYVDVVSALRAKPKEKYLQEVQGKLKKFVGSGQLGPFANGYWGHPEYKLPPDLNLLAVAHYLEALEMQKEASTVVAMLGGKMPMHMSTPPGGTTYVPIVEDLDSILWRLKRLQGWIDTVFLPDVLAIAPYYLKWAGIGKGVGNCRGASSRTPPSTRRNGRCRAARSSAGSSPWRRRTRRTWWNSWTTPGSRRSAGTGTRWRGRRSRSSRRWGTTSTRG